MNTKKKYSTFLAGIAVAALLLTGCSADTPAPGDGPVPDELTLVIASAVNTPKEEVAAYAVAQELGYFAEENLNVEVVNSEGSVAAVQAIASGSADITPTDAGAILAGAENGVDIAAIGGLVQFWPWQIATLPGSDIQTAADLRGANIGVISLASGSAPYARAFVNSAGLNAETDVNLLPVGIGAQAQAALESGQVDALALYTQVYAVLENEGVKLAYLDNTAAFDGLRSITFGASASAVAENGDVYERFLRASYKAMLFSVTNPEAAMQIGYRVFPQMLDGSSIEDRLDNDVNSLNAWLNTTVPSDVAPADLPAWGDIPASDWDATQAYMILAGQLTANQDLDSVWNSSLLEGANNFDAAAVIAQAEAWTP